MQPKVLRVVGGLDPLAGGPTSCSINSAIAVARQGCTTRIVVPDHPVKRRNDEAGLRRLVAAGVKVDVLPFGLPENPYLRSIGYSPAVSAHVRKLAQEYDLVHVEGAWLHTTLAAVRAAKACGRPVVMTPHESLTAFDTRGGRTRVLRRLKSPFRRYYLRVLDAVAFSSALELRDSVPNPESPRWTVVPHPVSDDTEHVRQQRYFEPDPGGPFRLGFLGRLHPKKNVELLIDALINLPAFVTLKVAGDGEAGYAAALRQRAQDQGVAGRIAWLGFIGGDAKADFLRKVDLLTMPSTYECFGMAVVEALIAGTPVLVSPQTGVAEVVQTRGAGLVVPTNTPAIARAITDLLDHREQLLRLSDGTTAAAAVFSFRTHSRSMVQLYTILVRSQMWPGKVIGQ